MLVINRRPGERVKIGTVVLTVLETHRGSVRLGFEGGGVLILRAELDEVDDVEPAAPPPKR